jgi:glycine cleavage system H protein
MTTNRKYTPSHEWIEMGDGQGLVGITNYAKGEFGEIVYIELPQVGKRICSGEEVVVLESTKAAADIYAPVSGEIIEVNEALKKDLSLLNNDPEGKGWLFKMTLSQGDEKESLLLNVSEYKEMISG